MEENVRPSISQQHPGQPPGSAAFNAVSTSYHIPPGQQPSSVQALAMQAVDGNMWNDVGSIRSCSTSMRYRPPPPPPPPKKPLKKRIKDAFRAFVAFVFSKVGICVLVIGYLFVGAAMFQQLEGPEEQLIRFQMGKYRSSVVKNLWKITEQYNTLHPANWSLEVTQIIEEYQARIVQEADKGYDGSDIPAHKWTFTGALLYSITVITTIGYGHIAPITPVGKLVTIFYAIVGIPVFLLYLSNIGDIMAKSFKWTYSRLCKCQRGPKPASEQMPSGILKKPQDSYRIQYIPQHVHGLNNQASSATQPPAQPNLPPEESTSSMASGPVGSEEYSDLDLYATRVYNKPSKPTVNLEDVTVPISLCLLVMVSYILGGAMLFSEWEGWGYLEGFYFSFITLSTIGFGDMVPGDSISDNGEAPSDPFNTKFVLCSLYILVGMALIAMCFNLMQEKVIKGVRSLGKRIASYKKRRAGQSEIAES